MSDFKKIATEIYELIKNSNPIIIHRHINPDGDALGSQWGLKIIIENNFPNKRVLAPGEMNDHMLPFFPTPTFVKKEDYENALVIICDTANRERISGEFWQQSKKIVKIDHHPIVDKYANVSLIEEKASAACQVVAKWAEIMKLKVSAEAARNLFLGLVTDSGRFLYRSVNEETFHVASFLMKQNFNLLDLYQSLYTQNLKIARIKGYILSNFKITEHGVGYIVFNDTIINELQTTINKQNKVLKLKEKVMLSKDDLTSQVNVMSNITGIKIWLIVAHDWLDSTIKVSVRSAKWIINDVVAKFGGGGHQTAAGVCLQHVDDIEKLINSLDKVAKNLPQLIVN
ncbi:bifunctional oligoribonuclease/PAP phosphatase NrnA [Spiroplasma endosymbiont of Nebria brevicollis]|uniref:DHH family phosphoesterase n=1 Tax=Spiroplasma endosymbiont of Nebria brevicollis TaxID=3066284 RepID=UPI00313A873E